MNTTVLANIRMTVLEEAFRILRLLVARSSLDIMSLYICIIPRPTMPLPYLPT